MCGMSRSVALRDLSPLTSDPVEPAMRAIIGAVALTVLAATPAFAEPTPAPTAPTPAQTTVVRQPTTVKGFKATVRTTTDGTVHRNKIRVFGGTPRQVEVQYSSDGTTWVTQKIKQTDPDGRVKIRMTVAPDRNRWRVKVPATADHKRVRTPVKTFAVQAKETESATPPSRRSPPPRSKRTRPTRASTSSTPTGGAMTSGWRSNNCGPANPAGTTSP